MISIVLGSIYGVGAGVIAAMMLAGFIKRDPYTPYGMGATFVMLFSFAAHLFFFAIPSP